MLTLGRRGREPGVLSGRTGRAHSSSPGPEAKFSRWPLAFCRGGSGQAEDDRPWMGLLFPFPNPRVIFQAQAGTWGHPPIHPASQPSSFIFPNIFHPATHLSPHLSSAGGGGWGPLGLAHLPILPSPHPLAHPHILPSLHPFIQPLIHPITLPYNFSSTRLDILFPHVLINLHPSIHVLSSSPASQPHLFISISIHRPSIHHPPFYPSSHRPDIHPLLSLAI